LHGQHAQVESAQRFRWNSSFQTIATHVVSKLSRQDD
jgi:hypothetical protein